MKRCKHEIYRWILDDKGRLRFNFWRTVFKATITENTLKVLVAPKDISDRGYQLDTSLLTVEFSSPMEDAIQ